MDTPTALTNEAIRVEMARRRVTQADIASALNLPQSQVSERLRGVVDWRLAELFTVANVLGVSIGAIVGHATEAA